MMPTVPAVELPGHSIQKRKTKVMRSKAQWRSLLDECATSGLTKTAFCKKHRISTSSLCKWQKFFNGPTGDAEFVDITEPLAKAESPFPVSESGNHWQVELELGAGVILRVRAI